MAMRRLIIAVIFLLGGLAAPFPAHAEPGDEAVDFVNKFGARAIEALTAPNLTDQELVSRFRTLFEDGFDVAYIARSSLGRFWPRASEQERSEFVPLFEDYVVQIYAIQFREYSGEKFDARSARALPGGGFAVLSDVVRPDGPTTKMEWSVYPVDGKQKIRDIKIEGVSMITTYRDQFANTILQSNGALTGLMDALKQKTAQLAAEASG